MRIPGGRSSMQMACVLLATLALRVAGAQDSAKLRAWIEAAPRLPLVVSEVAVQLREGEELGKVSWLARDNRAGVTWLIQRGEKADPVIAVDAKGRVLHSFGKGLYKIPHAIRLDPEGNVWTVDAGSSTVIKFSPQGEKLLQVDVGGMPERRNGFAGTTDIAFTPKASDLHQRRVWQCADSGVHGGGQEGSRMGERWNGAGRVPSAALDRRG